VWHGAGPSSLGLAASLDPRLWGSIFELKALGYDVKTQVS